MSWEALLHRTAAHAASYLDGVAERPVGRPVDPRVLREALPTALPLGPAAPEDVLDALVAAVEPGLVATAGPRYFGFVVGGALPAAVAADWMASAWDQLSGVYVASPAAAVVEERVCEWLIDLFGLPPETSAALVTGTSAAHVTALAAARHELLRRAGWDVEAKGLRGAPAIRLLVGEERHVTVDFALRQLGFGVDEIVPVAAGANGAMDAGALARLLEAGDGPALVCAQAGNVNTGAFDPFDAIADACAGHDTWLHVDGAFGLWAAAAPERAPLLAGVARADSWATDGHKWPNTPYDTGIVFVRDAEAHRAAMRKTSAYVPMSAAGLRDATALTPEFSRRTRAFALFAALCQLGREGLGELVERDCRLAARFAATASAHPDVEVLNDVVLNQTLLRFGDDDGRTAGVIDAVQRDGTFWASPSTWRGRGAMRVSVSSWATTEADVDRSVAALLGLLDGAN